MQSNCKTFYKFNAIKKGGKTLDIINRRKFKHIFMQAKFRSTDGLEANRQQRLA